VGTIAVPKPHGFGAVCSATFGLNQAFDPIDLTDLQSSVLEESEKELDELVRLSRARAAADFDCRHEARELLLPLGAWSVLLALPVH
jgi:hypothetical protein